MPPKRTGSAQTITRNTSHISLSASGTSQDNSVISEFGRKGIGKFRKVPKSTSETAEGLTPVGEELNRHAHEVEHEGELHHQLFESLRDCSRQRLRALRMTLRKHGSSESRITSKELYQILQENKIKISSRTFQLMVDMFQDNLGVDYERLWRSFMTAQVKSGRDSVMAQNRRNDLESQTIFTQEEKEADLIKRLTIQLESAPGGYDLPKLRDTFQGRDKNKTGKLKRVDTDAYMMEHNIPIFGALQTSLLDRCDMDKSDQISWPELMSFLEKAHHEATGQRLEPLKQERVRGRTAATPTANASQSSLSAPGAKPGTSPRTSRRRKGAAPRGKGAAAVVAKSKRAASAASSKSSTSKKGSDGKDVKASSEESLRSGKQDADPSGDQSQESDDKIPEPIAKEMIKAAFNKVVSNDDEQNSGTGENKSSTGTSGKNDKKKDGDKAAEAQGQDNGQTTITEEDESRSTTPTGPATRSKTSKSTKPSGQQDVTTHHDVASATPRDAKTTLPQNNKPTSHDLATRGIKSPRDLVKQSDQSSNKDGGDIRVHNGRMEVDIKGKKHVFDTPRDFDLAKVNTDPPQERLKLEWIYGYRGNDCRSNIYVLRSGEIVYFIGTVVILYNRDTHQQRHYREHTRDIKCIAVHPNGVTVATGQNAGSSTGESDSHVRLWRSDTLQVIHILGMGTMKKSVITLSFSRAQDRLCAVDSCDGHSLSVWEVSSGKLLAQSKMDLEVVCGVDFTPKDPDQIAVIGKEYLGWWKVYPDTQTVQLAQKADYQKFLRAKYIICLLHNEKGDLITGDSNGTIYIWGNGGNTITNFIKHGHDGPVFSLLFVRGTLITGGRDGMIYGWIWNKNMDQSGKIQIPKPEGGVRMLQNHRDRLLIGTTTNSILTATFSATALRNPLAGVELDKTALTMGHFGDIYGLCASDDPEFTSLVFTAGNDGILCLYDTDKRQPLWKFFLKGTKILCIDANTADGFIAIGTKDSIILLSIEKDEENQVFLSEISRNKVVKDKLTTIKLAPDCESIAAADSSGTVYIVGLRDAKEDEDEGEDEVWDLLKEIHAHKGPITGMDWSFDVWANTYLLRTSCSNAEGQIWNSETGEKVSKAQDLRNIKWFTNNCQLSYDVAGIWYSKQAQEGQISSIDVNLDRTLVAMGDSKGNLSLFRYPCSKKGAYSHTYYQHNHVHNVVFNKIGSRLITVGGADSTIIQWFVQ